MWWGQCGGESTMPVLPVGSRRGLSLSSRVSVSRRGLSQCRGECGDGHDCGSQWYFHVSKVT